MPAIFNFLLVLLGVGAAAGGAGGGGGTTSTPTPAPASSNTTPPLQEEDEVPPEEEDNDPPAPSSAAPPPEPESEPIVEAPSSGSDAPDLPNSAYALNWEGLTAAEQYMLELVNRARMDPEAEEDRTGELVDADGVNTTPKQALAVDPILAAAADNHSADMLARDFFDHDNPDGDGPTDRAVDEGWTGRGVWENISARWTGAQSISDQQAWIDASHFGLWKSDGHQKGMLWDSHTVTGISVDIGSDWDYPAQTAETAMVVTEKFSNDSQTYLTGVVYDDGDGDDFYDMGEGQGGVKITIWNDDDTYATSTWDAGGYSIAVDAGTYNVRFEGGDLSTAFETEVTIGSQNVKLDVNEDDVGAQFLSMVPDEPALDDDPIAALFLSAEASAEVIEEQARIADQATEPEVEDLLEYV